MSEQWVTVPNGDRVDVIAVSPGHPGRRVVALGVLPVDAAVMIAQQDGLAGTVRTLRNALEQALDYGDHNLNCPIRLRRGVTQNPCCCWKRTVSAAMGEDRP